MTITEFAVSTMTDKDVLDIIKRSCNRWGFNLLRAYFIRSSLEVYLLFDGQCDDGHVSMDVDGALAGYLDRFTFEDLNCELSINSEVCPNTICIKSKENYDSITSSAGGVELCKMIL